MICPEFVGIEVFFGKTLVRWLWFLTKAIHFKFRVRLQWAKGKNINELSEKIKALAANIKENFAIAVAIAECEWALKHKFWTGLTDMLLIYVLLLRSVKHEA